MGTKEEVEEVSWLLLRTSDWRTKQITAYEFYFHNESGESHLIGVLPERRRDPGRITDESIINWARNLLGQEQELEFKKIAYVTVKVEKTKDEIFYPTAISQNEL